MPINIPDSAFKSQSGGAVNDLGKLAGYGGTALSTINALAPTALAGTALAAAPLTLGISAIPLAITLFEKIGAGRRNANTFVQDYQDAFFKQVMVPIQQQSMTDPAGAQARMATEWQAFLGQVQKYAAQNPTSAKVVQQALSTPAFINTAQSLLPQNGKSPLDPVYTSGNSFQSQNTNPSPSVASSAIPLIASAGADVAGHYLNAPGAPNTPTTPGTPGSPDVSGQTEGGGISDSGDATPVSSGSNPLSTVGTAGKVIGAVTGTGGTGTSNSPSLLQTLLGAGVAGTDIYGAISGANAANNATQIQSDAATKAAQLQADTAAAALKQQQSQFDTTQANQQPWLDAGKQALGTLTGSGPGSLTDLSQPFTDKFSFTQDDLLKDPGYQNRINEAQQAAERSASSKGNLFSAGTTAAISNKIGADASDEYSTAYSREQQDYLNKYNIFTGNANNTFNKEASVAGLGQTANAALQTAGQNLVNSSDNTSQTAATNTNDINLGLANATAKNGQTASSAVSTGLTNASTDLASLISAYLKKAA